MSLGPALTTVVVTGNYVDYEGTPIEGQIRFSSSTVLQNGTDDQMVAPTTVVVPLVNGSFSVTLPATNDPDILPNPFVYSVEESFPSGRSYTITLPYTATGALDLADISPNPTLDEEYTALVSGFTWAQFSAQVDELDANINQSTNQMVVPAYWAIPVQFATYANLNAYFATYQLLYKRSAYVTTTQVDAYVTAAQTSATTAAGYATETTNTLAGTINPMLLIGG